MMKKMMMILVAVAAIGFTSCQKGTDANKDQTEQTDSTKAAQKDGEVAAQDANKADNAAPTDAKAEVKAEDKAEK